jgi:hypothetical protein
MAVSGNTVCAGDQAGRPTFAFLKTSSTDMLQLEKPETFQL